MRLITRGLLLSCLSVTTVVAAQSVPTASPATVTGEVVVADRGDVARSAALPALLADALRRLSPDDSAAAHIDTAAALQADPTLLQRYEYAQRVRPTASGIPSIKLMLRGWFRAAAAQALLVRAGLPVWPGGEVRVGLWLVDDSEGRRQLRDADSVEALSGLGTALAERGIVLQAAINDLDDWRMAEQLDADNAGAGLAAAARRSAADPALLAWLRAPGEDGVGIDWFLYDGTGIERFSSSGADTAEALDAALPRLLALLAERHAVRPGAVAAASAERDRGAGDYRFWLAGLTRAGAYAEATALLSGQPVVTAVAPEQADGDRIRVRVTLNAGLGELLALLAADGRLVPDPVPVGDADLILRWQPL